MIGRHAMRIWLGVIVAAVALSGRTGQAQTPASEQQLETFLGLSTGGGLNSGALTNLGNGPVTSGSAMVQSLDVAAGATLTFDYNFLTNAPSLSSNPLGAVDPFAFTTVPTLTTIADNGYNFNPPTNPAAGTGYLYQTGYQTDSITFTTAGPVSLGFGVANVTTDAYSSALLLDNMTLTSGGITTTFFDTGNFSGFSTIGLASVVTSDFGVDPSKGTYQVLLQTATVPEPASIVLLVLGLVAVVGYGRHKARSRARNERPGCVEAV